MSDTSGTMGIENEPINGMTIIEYVKYIRDKYYPDIDISYMDAFMKMYDNPDKKGYCICSDELANAGILSIRSDKKTLRSNAVLEFFDRSGLVENRDYKEVVSIEKYNPKGGRKPTKYMMTIKAFKLCLISSFNQPKYKLYYILLEECTHYYINQLVNSRNNELVDSKDNELKALYSKLNQLHMDNQALRADNQALRVDNEALHAKYVDKTDKSYFCCLSWLCIM